MTEDRNDPPIPAHRPEDSAPDGARTEEPVQEQPPVPAAELGASELDFLHQVFDLARDGRTEELAPLLDAGIPVDLTDAKGDTLLNLAAYREHPETVKALLERGADADRINDRGQTALCCSVFRNNGLITTMLLEAGADPSLGTQTPAAIAEFFGLEDIAEILEEHAGKQA